MLILKIRPNLKCQAIKLYDSYIPNGQKTLKNSHFYSIFKLTLFQYHIMSSRQVFPEKDHVFTEFKKGIAYLKIYS